MKCTDFENGIILLEYPTAKELGTAFVRMQEFYENPSKKFRGKYFKFKTFQTWYSKHFGDGKFSYFTDYEGYNLPGKVFVDFIGKFGHKLHPEENKIFLSTSMVAMKTQGKRGLQDHYIIGAIKGERNTIDHELSHAFFHLFPSYRKEVKRLLKRHKFKDIKHYLKSKMYSEEVFEDEIAAYLMFDAALLESEGVDTGKYDQTAMDLHKLFKKHVALHMSK